MRRSLLIPGVAIAGALGGTAVAVRRTLNQWAQNPDPLHGQPPRFPPGQSRTVQTDDGAEIYTRRSGAGPTIVLVHGLTSNHDDWGPVAERLVAAGFEVVAVDQRGHGGSTVGRDGFGVERQAADLAQVLVALDVRDALLAGHSMGGMAAMGVAVHDPEVLGDRVAGLGLVATSATMQQRHNQVQFRIGATPPARRLGRHPEWFTIATGKTVLGARPSLGLVRASLASYHRCPEATRIGAAQGLLDFDILERLPGIDCPTLVVCGDHDRLTPHARSEEIADGIPNARLVTLADAGHMVIWEEIDQLADLLAGFARDVQAGTRTTTGSG
ncbi:MAG: alpha/beta fold hydrolase [Acidimicrobiales bacterium]